MKKICLVSEIQVVLNLQQFGWGANRPDVQHGKGTRVIMIEIAEPGYTGGDGGTGWQKAGFAGGDWSGAMLEDDAGGSNEWLV